VANLKLTFEGEEKGKRGKKGHKYGRYGKEDLLLR